MASPISPGEILAVVKFAYGLAKACRAAKGEWLQVGREVNAMRSVVELVQIRVEDPTSIINKLDNKQKSTRKKLGVHIGNCNQALKDVDSLLKKYSNMNTWFKTIWALSAHDEVQGLMANLSSFATQLDSFVNALALEGIDKIYEKQHSMRMGIGRIEELLEINGGNAKAAVKEVMQHVNRTCNSRSHSQRYETVLDEYAEEVKKTEEQPEEQCERNEERGRKSSASTLGVPGNHKRAKSADNKKDNAKPDIKRSRSARSSIDKKPRFILECWLIQIKSGDAMFLKWQFSEKEFQPRGQWKLEQMAKQFRASKDSTLNASHDLVEWVVKDRQKNEKNQKCLWQPHAAKIESKGLLSLSMGVEEQAMVIIKRNMTPDENAKEDAKERKAKIEREAAEKKAKAMLEAKKAKEAAVKEAEKKRKETQKAEEERAKRKAEIEKLRLEVERLKLAQKKSKEGKLESPAEKGKGKSKSPNPNPKPDKRRNSSSATKTKTMNTGVDHSQIDCKYYPNCRDSPCLYRHPSAPWCRYGNKCSNMACTYSHRHCTSIPCFNTECQYRHYTGQQKVKPTV